MPLRDVSEPVTAGDVVELLDGTISRVITGGGSIFVVSTHPSFVANKPAGMSEDGLKLGRPVVRGRGRGGVTSGASYREPTPQTIPPTTTPGVDRPGSREVSGICCEQG